MPIKTSVLFLLFTATSTFADDGDWEVRGRILDDLGKPVVDVDISQVWNANGYDLGHLAKMKRFPLPEIEVFNKEVYRPGRWEPWGSPTKTDRDGLFSFQMSENQYKLLAIDKERHLGAVIVFDRNDLPSLVEVKLQPLVKVHGKIHFSGPHFGYVSPVDEHVVFASLPVNVKYPLGYNRLGLYFSKDHHFEFRLPPGKYEIDVQRATPERSVSVTAEDNEVDLGTLELTAHKSFYEHMQETKAKGEWRDYTKHYGEALPEWNVVDVRGVEKDVELSDYEGKWVLLYFWAPNCYPCLQDGLPKLMEFYETHKMRRDKFEILAFCIDEANYFKSLKQVEKWLEPIVQKTWSGQEIPFPMLYDNTFSTAKRLGVPGYGYLFLVNPEGKLVEGDESTLAKILPE